MNVSTPARPETPRAEHANLPPLRLRGLTKKFPGVIANEDVDLDILPGEIHAVLGENGAGKSTLMKMMFGFYQPTSGEIFRGDELLHIHSPHDGRAAGIGMVFQNFTLVSALTVAENCALALPHLPFILPTGSLAARIREVSDRYGFGIDPASRIRELSMGEQQKVEILKLLLADARYLVFDESTSVLAPHEADELLRIFQGLKADGFAVVFITHKLREVLQVADRITVLRRGRVTATIEGRNVTEAELVGVMLGSSAADAEMPRVEGAVDQANAPVVVVGAANVPATGKGHPLQAISLEIRPGEILGVAGVAGNGQVELGEFLMGLRHCAEGEYRLFGEDVHRLHSDQLIARGVSCVPEDPLRAGAIPAMTVLENMVLTDRRRFERGKGLFLAWRKARETVEQSTSRFGFSLPRLGAAAAVLSGGNVQRMVFARELAREPRFLVCFYPARGMDVPSANAARRCLLERRAAGAAILLVSEELDELFALSDRLMVMHHGHVAGTFLPGETTPEQVGFLMTGAHGGSSQSATPSREGESHAVA